MPAINNPLQERAMPAISKTTGKPLARTQPRARCPLDSTVWGLTGTLRSGDRSLRSRAGPAPTR
jgi:hypothetical protein